VVEGIIEALRQRGHSLRYHEAPDLKGTRSADDRKLVDFVLLDEAHDRARWNVEVKRLVPQHVREQDLFARRKLACLNGILTGTYTAKLWIDSADPSSRVNESALNTAIAEMLGDAGRGKIVDVYDAISDCTVGKVREDGSLAVPWLWDYELRMDEPRGEAALGLLSVDFRRHLANARAKFAHNPASRNLLVVETRGTLLDRMMHMWPSASGPSAMSSWMAANSTGWTPNDLVVVDPHVSVGQLIGSEPNTQFRVVLTGTIYSEDAPYAPLGTPWRLWPEPAGHL